MRDIPFIGREQELKTLFQLQTKSTSSLVVIKGRRRIGKSRLVKEFALQFQAKTKEKREYFSFTGLPPSGETTAQSQRDEFMRQLCAQLGLPVISMADWGDIFTFLAQQIKAEKAIVLLDEITWMGSNDPLFLGKLKVVWDLHFQNHPHLIMVLCGSVSSWIEKNILKSTGFFGRITLTVALKELEIHECHQLLGVLKIRMSALEEFMILSITGGIPWYLQLFNPGLSVLENIRNLCFSPEGTLVTEFGYIFHDLFDRRGEICKKIIDALSNGPRTQSEIAEMIHYETGGPLSAYMDDLIAAGFITRNFTWSVKTGQTSSLSQYALSDNYVRFYLKFIAPNRDKIQKGQFINSSLSSLSGFDVVMGHQFETLVLKNRHHILERLGVNVEDIVTENPFFQKHTKEHPGCQIDYLVQTKFNTLYLCEMKFSKNKVGARVIQEVQEKIHRLKRPKGFSIRPVLIHMNGIEDSVEQAEFFDKIIDFGDFLV